MTVEIRKIKETEADLHYNGEWVGVVKGDLQLSDIRVQIKEQGLEGYSIIWKGLEFPIDKNGRIDEWPDGFFDEAEKLLWKLL